MEQKSVSAPGGKNSKQPPRVCDGCGAQATMEIIGFDLYMCDTCATDICYIFRPE